MRKVRNHDLHGINPGLAFARGVEQLVEDKLYKPSRDDTLSQRRERPSAATETRATSGSFFSVFLHRFGY